MATTRFHKSISKENYKVEPPHVEPIPDITDFMMNDWFYGTTAPVKKVDPPREKDEKDGLVKKKKKDEVEKKEEEKENEEEGHVVAGRKSISSTTSRLTHDWLEEAKRMVAESPSRHASPSRHVGSPRFVSPQLAREPLPLIERRDPLLRSARRDIGINPKKPSPFEEEGAHKSVVIMSTKGQFVFPEGIPENWDWRGTNQGQRSGESISNEILLKSSARHSRANSVLSSPPLSPTGPTPTDKSPASAVLQWFSNILKPQPDPNPLTSQPHSPPLPPKLQKHPRKSRFQHQDPAAPPVPLPPKPTFRDASPSRKEPPPSSSPSSPQPPAVTLSPPRNLVESVHRRSLSSSTCSSLDAAGPAAPRRPSVSLSSELLAASVDDDVRRINLFLRRQRARMERAAGGEAVGKVEIVLTGSTTGSVAAAIGYAWLVENREKKKVEVEEEEEEEVVVVPVVNVRRGRMWMHRQTAWLFHYLGIDASALLFRDEVDLEGLIMGRQLSTLEVGHDVLKTNGEVGSECTILTDNYCEDAYSLLQSPNLKKLLLAGILLDTQNLNSAAKLCTNRDVEAVQLLLVGSSPNYRHDLFEQLMRDHRNNLFLEAMISNYGKPYSEGKEENGGPQEPLISTQKSTAISPKEAKVSSLVKKDNGVPQEPGQSTRKSTPISPKDAKVPSSTKQRTSPAAAPEPAPPAAPTKPPQKSKNKNFFSKLFGFGSK